MSNETRKRLGLERNKANLCARCGKQPPAEGLAACRSCLDRIASYRRSWGEAGLCNRCGKAPPLASYKVCKACHEKGNAKYLQAKKDGAQRWIYRRNHSLCQTCGEPIDASDTFQGKPRRTCDECRAARRLEKAKQRNWRYPHIIERDGGACQLCGCTSYLCVHHIDGVGSSCNGKPVPYAERHDDPDNLITLCKYCHHALTQLRRLQNDRQLAAKLILAEPSTA